MLIKHAGIAGVLVSGMAPAVHAQALVRWRLAPSFPKSLDTIYGGAEIFAQYIKTVSGGRFDISVHAAGELMPAFGGAIPFGLNSRQMSAWTFHGNGLKLMREFYAGYNIINFACGNTGALMGGWFCTEVKALGDMKGLKVHIGGFGGKVHERQGSVPLNIPGGGCTQLELYVN